MSLYLKVERFGAAPRLLRVRAFATAVGLDCHGVLCTGVPVEPHFTVFNHNGAFIIRPENTAVTLQGRILAPGVLEAISPGDQIRVFDFVMTAFITTESAEFFPTSGQQHTRWGHLTLAIAGLRQIIPLYGGLFSVGSASDDTLHLPISGILPRHIQGEIQGDMLSLSAPLGGALIAGSDLTVSGHQGSEDVEVQLEPTGLVLRFMRAELTRSVNAEDGPCGREARCG